MVRKHLDNIIETTVPGSSALHYSSKICPTLGWKDNLEFMRELTDGK